MNTPRVTLEQWRAFHAVIDCGGYAQAAEALGRSQSSISYTVAKLQEQLGARLLEIRGRKAELTELGKVVLHRSRELLQEAVKVEELAEALEQGWEPEIRVVMDEAFPTALLMQALKEFAPLSRGSRVQLRQVVLTGAAEALLGGADLVVGYQIPQGYLGEELLEVEFLAVAQRDHPLHALGRPLTLDDLARELQVVIRDSGGGQQKEAGWVGRGHRWTVSSIETAVTSVVSGLGFAWLPRHAVAAHLESGELKALPLRGGQGYRAHLYLVFGQQDNPGPATRELAEILRRCARAGEQMKDEG